MLQNVKMPNLVILKWRYFEYKTKFEKIQLFVRSAYYKNIPRNLCIVIGNFKLLPLCSTKWQPFKVFAKLHGNLLLIANIAKKPVSRLRQFLATKIH